jgi:translation initiation factor IF-3
LKNNTGLVCPFVVKFVMFETTRLIDIDGQFHPSFKVADALIRARENDLQLVCFNRPEGTNLAFCKIINFNKWQYAEEKKKKKQQLVSRKETKEIKFSLHIEQNDIVHKMRQVNNFLDEGDDVILSMQVRGRDRIYFNTAELKMNDIVKMCEGHGKEASRKKTNDTVVVRMVKCNKINMTNNVQEKESGDEQKPIVTP